MSKNMQSGLEGEQQAAEYLRRAGWEIVEMNYRHKRAEIDIIARRGKILIFVEVKTRSNVSFGQPEDFVDKKKANLIIAAADHYIHEIDWKEQIRFDIISVHQVAPGEIMHFEDAFY